MIKRRFIRIFLIVCAVLCVAGCAGNRPEIEAEPEYLPGIYPDVRAAAEIQAEKLIATTQMKAAASEHQSVGDSFVATSEDMWQVFLKAANNPNFSINSLDESVENAVEPADSLVPAESTRLAGDSISPDLLKLTAELYLQHGIQHYEQAILANPLDLQLYLRQGEITSQKAQRFGDKNAAEKSIQEYEHLLRFQKGQHALYSRLGQNYEELDQWASAYQNHQMALEIYHGSQPFYQLRHALADSADAGDAVASQLTEVNYWINKANAETRLFIADDALLSWYIALRHATEVADIKFICENIEHVMWDSLNIEAVVQRDSILTRWVREENAQKTVTDYLNLLPQLKTRRAFDEVSALAADVEFTDENSREQALDRILEIVRRTDGNPATADLAEAPIDFMDYYFLHLDSTGTRVVYDRNIDTSDVIYQKISSYKLPVDSTYRKIYQLAGQMCFEYGTYQMEHGKFEFAQKYLESSCSIEWPERFLALYKLARFYSVRANPKAAISKCYDIALMHNSLNQRQVKEYLSLLVRLFRNRKIRQREVAQEIYQIYTVYNKGGRIPWDTIYRYLEPYQSF